MEQPGPTIMYLTCVSLSISWLMSDLMDASLSHCEGAREGGEGGGGGGGGGGDDMQ